MVSRDFRSFFSFLEPEPNTCYCNMYKHPVFRPFICWNDSSSDAPFEYMSNLPRHVLRRSSKCFLPGFLRNLGSFKSWTLLQRLTLLVKLENLAAPGDKMFWRSEPLELARGLGFVEQLLQKQAHYLRRKTSDNPGTLLDTFLPIVDLIHWELGQSKLGAKVLAHTCPLTSSL